MTALVRVFLVGLTLVLVPGVALAQPRSSAKPAYQIRELTAPAGTRFYPNAINGPGQVVGEISSHGGSTQRAAVYAGHLIDVGTPTGFANSAGLGISYMGAVLVRVWNPGRSSRPFVAEPHNSRYAWESVHTGIRGYYLKSIEAIDANGDLAGTVQRPGHAGSQRAAVWFPTTTGGYSHATVVPPAGQRKETEADTIWSGDGRVVVAGGGQLWSRSGGGAFHAAFNTFGLSASVIGGYRNQVFVIGTTDTGSNYGDPVSPEASLILFSKKGDAVTSRLVNLITSTEPYIIAHSVSAGWPKGGFVAVGAASSGDGQGDAFMWRGLAGISVHGEKVQRLLPGLTPWRLADAVGVNRIGEIVGTGSIHGRYAAYMITPAYRLNCPCYCRRTSEE